MDVRRLKTAYHLGEACGRHKTRFDDLHVCLSPYPLSHNGEGGNQRSNQVHNGAILVEVSGRDFVHKSGNGSQGVCPLASRDPAPSLCLCHGRVLYPCLCQRAPYSLKECGNRCRFPWVRKRNGLEDRPGDHPVEFFCHLGKRRHETKNFP